MSSDRILVVGGQDYPRFLPILKVSMYLGEFEIRPRYIEGEFCDCLRGYIEMSRIHVGIPDV